MFNFEVKQDPQMMPKLFSKSKVFLNAFVFSGGLRKSSLYYNKSMVFKDSWFQKSKGIINKCGRKPGPKKTAKH